MGSLILPFAYVNPADQEQNPSSAPATDISHEYGFPKTNAPEGKQSSVDGDEKTKR
jgi:hypothetical protein